MAAARILIGAFLAGLLGSAAAFAQPGLSAPPAAPFSAGNGMPYVAPPASVGDGGATSILTAPPLRANPPGTVASPWCGGTPAGAACCGPVGANGPVTYELYVRTGPTFIIGGSRQLSAATQMGWNVTGGGRTLLLNQAGDAAWVLDLGLSYNYNRGDSDRVLNVFSPQPRDPNTGQLQGPDEGHPFRVRGLHRTTFNYAIGRDWFLNGPGFVGAECAWNSRVGLDVGGRYGTNHIDLVPVANTAGYLRRSGISHTVFLATHWTWEKPMGAWILFGGIRAELGHTWMNLVPPTDGNIQDINVLLTTGFRF